VPGSGYISSGRREFKADAVRGGGSSSACGSPQALPQPEQRTATLYRQAGRTSKRIVDEYLHDSYLACPDSLIA
jgi:hypothetical protein